MPRVINKVHIGPKFEDIIYKRFSVSKTLSQHASRAQTHQKSTTNNELSKWLLQNAREGETRWVRIIPNVALAGLYAIHATSHQISGLVDRQAYIQII